MTKTRFGGVFAVPAAAALLCATALSTPERREDGLSLDEPCFWPAWYWEPPTRRPPRRSPSAYRSVRVT